MSAYARLQALLPRGIRDYVLHFEASIERSVTAFADSLPAGTTVLDAGAGEGQYADRFTRHRYTGVDLGIGDNDWNYAKLDAIADLLALPFRDDTFDAAINIVTLEHVKEPARVITELWRVLKPQGRLLIVVPHEWEEHQTPHDYFRYTRYGLRYLLERAGFTEIQIEPVGGYFRLMSRRLLNALQFFPAPVMIVVAVLIAPMALIAPLFDGLDRGKNFTLGFICKARK
ncbi:MAG TPA: class I SAM-dependent methyltransferase [Bryobacteraceae bacterium]